MLPARKKAGKLVLFFVFVLLVTKLLLRTDAIPYRPIFIYTCLCVEPWMNDSRMITCVKEEKERRKERNKQSKYSVVKFQMLSIQHNNT